MKTIFSVLLLLAGSIAFGQNEIPVPVHKGINFDTNMFLIIIVVCLLLPIWILSNTFIVVAKRFYTDKIKSGTLKIVVPLGMILMSTSLLAQQATTASSPGSFNNTMTIILLCAIGVELMLLIYFAHKIKDFIQKTETTVTSPAKERGFLLKFKEKWAAMNFKPIEEEHKIDTGHSYDGIRELDNIIPPWFTTAFIITILFGVGYLYRYHIAKSAPMQIQEYKNAVVLAEMQHDEYLKTQASSIDETNVKFMTGADLEAGKKTFVTICSACHKTDGGGMVGPNLTDDYWIHGGALKDIFKTIKYGYPDKGMISWKAQLSPIQIAQVSNYILTLKGTNPPDAKEKQGTLYIQEAVQADTISASTTQTDTLTTK